MKIKLSKSVLGSYCVALAALVTQAHAGNPPLTFSPFIDSESLGTIYSGDSSPIGITYTGNGFVGTGGYNSGSPLLYQTGLNGSLMAPNTPTGSISTFGSLVGPSNNIAGENVLSASPDGSLFGSNQIYAGSGGSGNILTFASAHSTPTIFATTTSGDVRGISFDTSGLYNNDMIVTTTSGAIDEISSTGQVDQLAYLGTDTEGIGFATQQFGTFAAGTLFTASENTDWINAISPLGAVTPVFQIPDAESISFVPTNIASDTNPLDGLYGVNWPDDIEFAAASEFVPYAGDVIVTSEIDGGNPNIYAVSLNSDDQATITGIGTIGDQPEDSIFVTSQTLQVHGGGVPDGGNAAVMLLFGVLSLGALAHRRKSAHSTGTPAS